jgi:hypothetical protein
VYPTIRCIAAELESKHTATHEAINHTIHALYTTLVPMCFSDSTLPHRAYTRGSVAGVRLVVDSTFLILPHHSDKDERKQFYHFKSPTRQALKWQLTVTTDGEPWHISDVVHGSKADIMLLRESRLLDRLSGGALLLGDKGYAGEAKIITPKKKPRLAELKDEEKAENKEKNSKRVVVENCFHEFKRWAILGGEYRESFREASDMERAKQVVLVVGAMVKRHLARHPLRADPAATD